jgi:DNA polymerase-3 subunit delta'
VVVIEEADTMTEAAANALLKTLEEPGKGTLILIAPSPSSLLPTLVSRCQHIPFQRLSEENLAQVLRSNGHARVLNYPAILGLAQGSPGEAIAALEFLDSLPQDLPQSFSKFPLKLSQALELAKIIPQTLDTETQLWYVSYLQYEDWQRRRERINFRNLGKNPPAAVSLRSTPFSLGMHLLGIGQAIHRPKVLKLLYLSIKWGERP